MPLKKDFNFSYSPTMQKKALDQDDLIDEDTLFTKELGMELQQCNDMAPSNEEKDLNYDNEWYWSGRPTFS